MRTNRTSELDLDRMAMKVSSLQCILGGLSVLDALEEYEGVAASRIGGNAIKRAVLSEEIHEIRVRHVAR